MDLAHEELQHSVDQLKQQIKELKADRLAAEAQVKELKADRVAGDVQNEVLLQQMAELSREIDAELLLDTTTKPAAADGELILP